MISPALRSLGSTLMSWMGKKRKLITDAAFFARHTSNVFQAPNQENIELYHTFPFPHTIQRSGQCIFSSLIIQHISYRPVPLADLTIPSFSHQTVRV